MMKIILVAGARPNFMKIAPLMAAFQARPEITPILVHTGQHYDPAMSDLFFQQLGIPEPDVNLGVGSASHAVQTAEIMRAFEPVVLAEKPDAVLVVGDVNSTIACGLVAVKLGVKLIHVEAGLRSFDRTMPEEINRLLTDAISYLLFCSEQSGVDNLRREGVPEEKIHMVGNVMIDTLLKNREKAERPVTVEMGTNRLVGSDPVRILEAYREVMAVNRADPDVLWVGMTAPKQEKWIYKNKDNLNVKFIVAVGAVFDFYAGNVKRSHPWFLKHGLEWLPRLLQEPRRLWRRSFISAPVFFWHVFKQRIKK